MAEVIYYADYNVKITSDWARLGQQVYQVADIGAVAVQTAQPKPPRTGLWKWIPNLAKLALAIATMNLVILTLNWLVVPDSSFLKTLLSFLSGLLWFLYAGVMLLSSRQASLLPKPVTTIQLNGTFGNVDAITTNDAGYAQMIAFAINQAVARRAATVTDAQQGPAIDWSSVPPVIFRPNDDIQITSNWLMFGKRSFRAINLRYTELKRKRIDPTWQLERKQRIAGWTLTALSLVCLVVGIPLWIRSVLHLGPNPIIITGLPSHVVTFLMAGFLFVAGMIVLIFAEKNKLKYAKYESTIRLWTAIGSFDVCTSADQAKVDSILYAINLVTPRPWVPMPTRLRRVPARENS